MTTPLTQEVTELLLDWGKGDRGAYDKLVSLVYDELHRLAHRYMNNERRNRRGHTLQTTALVDEAYLRLVDQRNARFENRTHFFAIAAEVMRRILVDHARSHIRAKRGGGAQMVELDEAASIAPERSTDLVALDEALTDLAKFDARKARVVELRFFGGLDVNETAAALAVHPNTVIKDWSLAKAWLYSRIVRQA
ncbi:MAG TPA: sigma-70 family RNA polymerase sigma factor [Pyrinomonadaceae bacterium]|jgi:RNA polymerase sigma factor (TIGR02999 family)|nr:sigma-70 family RNA polymerase sigma factor [Pyrinomonadaceae bacterium]